LYRERAMTRTLLLLTCLGCAAGADRPIEHMNHDAITAPCAQPLGSKLPVASVDAMRATLVGSWALCSEHGLFGAGEGGFIVGADDRYRELAWVDDTLAQEGGLDHEGSVTYEDTSMYTGLMTIQVDFVLDTDAFIPVIPVFSDDPRVLLFSDEGPRYVPAP
jgi:hypothetical protein